MVVSVQNFYLQTKILRTFGLVFDFCRDSHRSRLIIRLFHAVCEHLDAAPRKMRGFLFKEMDSAVDSAVEIVLACAGRHVGFPNIVDTHSHNVFARAGIVGDVNYKTCVTACVTA